MNIQAAFEVPHFTKLNFGGCDVQMGRRISVSIRAELERKGHKIQLLSDFSPTVGGGQADMRDSANGVSYGASDPRKDEEAIPEPWLPN